MCLAVPGEVLTIEQIVCPSGLTMITGDVRFGSVVTQVNLSLVPDVRLGDFVIAHVGCAIARLDTAAALGTLGELEDLQNKLAEQVDSHE